MNFRRVPRALVVAGLTLIAGDVVLVASRIAGDITWPSLATTPATVGGYALGVALIVGTASASAWLTLRRPTPTVPAHPSPRVGRDTPTAPLTVPPSAAVRAVGRASVAPASAPDRPQRVERQTDSRPDILHPRGIVAGLLGAVGVAFVLGLMWPGLTGASLVSWLGLWP